jgi:CheY-like chemotaxis protein
MSQSVQNRLRVLVVDDNHDSADSCAMLLEFSGHTVRVAYDGASALDIANEFRPEAALVDIGMPLMDGYEVVARIRALPWGTQSTLIAMTGRGLEEDKRRSFSAGFDHHLTKPIDVDALAALLEQRVNKSQKC